MMACDTKLGAVDKNLVEAVVSNCDILLQKAVSCV